MKYLFIKVCCKLSGKSTEKLSRDFSINYFLTRSKTRAYWRTVFS